MKPVTLRDVPAQLAREIGERTRARAASLNRTVIEMLEEGAERKDRRNKHDLDHLFGTLSADEVGELDRAIAAQRRDRRRMWP